MNWYFNEPTSRRRVEGGIKARTKRGQIGEQWWSRRFIDVLESYGVGGRLQRGRTYARAGQVVHLALGPGVVVATVQGSRAEPYQVTIRVERLADETWREVEAALAARAVFRAKLLAGEMPQAIEDVFDDVGAPLFPEALADFDMECSCPDWGLPCKHQAAVLYLLAERFDDDPFQVLLWRGKERDDLLNALRARAPAAASEGPPPVVDAPLEDCQDAYWEPRVSLARLRTHVPTPPSPPDLVLRLAEPPTLQVGRRRLADVLATVYQHLGGSDDE
ncbi:MAG TPA: SWIM zinc finger family protein [Jiangellaceae bacterium]|nr:SWIM zinc finger family protein [Jiangellaceae bacterium]